MNTVQALAVVNMVIKRFVALRISRLKMLVPTAASYGVLTYHTGSWVKGTQIGACI